MSDRDNRSSSVSLSYSTRRASTAVRASAFPESSLAVSLDEVRGRRADSDNEVGRLFRIKGVKVFDERAVRCVVVQPGIQKRVVMKIHWPLRVRTISERMICA